MHMELLQNGDTLMRILILSVPAAVAFLVSVIYLFARKRDGESEGLGGEDLNSSTMLFLPVYGTSFMYAVMEVLLLLHIEGITVEKIGGISLGLFLVIGLLNGLSCIAKGILGGRMLLSCVGAEKQRGTSRALLFMSAAEVPGILALALCLMKVVL